MNTANIMTNPMAGDKQATFLEVMNTQPKSVLGARHNPMPYADSIEFLKASIEKHGFSIVGESYVLAAGGDRLFALYQIESDTTGYSTMLAFNRSYDQSVAFNIGAGIGTWICSNLELHGQHTIKTKQTTFIYDRIVAKIDGVISKLPTIIEETKILVESYQNTLITKEEGDHHIIEMVRKEIVTTSQVGRMVREWDTPTYAEHTQYNVGTDRALSQLSAAYTESQKPVNGRGVLVPAFQRTPLMTDYMKQVVLSHAA